MSVLKDSLIPYIPQGWETDLLSPVINQFIIWSAIVGLLVFGWMLYAFFRYRDDGEIPEDAPEAGVFPVERGSNQVEIIWTVGPLILVTWLTYVSLAPLDYYWDNPDHEDTFVVQVTAQQWFWTFTYEDGTSTINELYVPANTDVVLELKALDVIHSFYIIELGVKEDIPPNVNTKTWFDTSLLEPGNYLIQCTEYCGENHSNMLATLIVEEG
tara:strand:+ start:168 stop:806 length:639 start_codon:yes stop_codon:yes gene_type:complete